VDAVKAYSLWNEYLGTPAKAEAYFKSVGFEKEFDEIYEDGTYGWNTW
jgi:hypothetical protein